jgi:hypothetical protein
MRSHQLTMMAAKIGTLVFGHEVRPGTSVPRTGVQGDRIASTRRKRAP